MKCQPPLAQFFEFFDTKGDCMSKELPKITCPHHGCWKTQHYRGQTSCIHCGGYISPFTAACQLGERICQGNTRPTRHLEDP